MESLESVLFTKGSVKDKVAYIEGMTTRELLKVGSNIVRKIYDLCGGDRLYIRRSLRRGNKWNSEVEGIWVTESSDKLLVLIYVQNSKTDTSMTEYFNKFFSFGEYYSSNNNLGANVRYSESQKGEVMRSILLEFVKRTYDEGEVEDKRRKDIVAKITHYSIVNPVLNNFYRYYKLEYVSSFSPSRYDGVKLDAYHAAQKALSAYIYEHCDELSGLSKEELQKIYTKVFGKVMEDYIKENY